VIDHRAQRLVDRVVGADRARLACRSSAVEALEQLLTGVGKRTSLPVQ
jgi:hypothetical protein